MCRMLVCVVAACIAGCAGQHMPSGLIGPVSPIGGELKQVSVRGFSIDTPRSGGWAYRRTEDGVAFFKQLVTEQSSGPDGVAQRTPRTTMVTVHLGAAKLIGDLTTQNIKDAAEEAVQSQQQGRQRILDKTIAPDRVSGADCVRYEALIEERDNPRWPGAALEIVGQGLVCRHPFAPNRLVYAHASERRLRGNAQNAGTIQDPDIDTVLGSIRFVRL